MRLEALRVLAAPHTGAPLEIVQRTVERDGELLDGLVREGGGGRTWMVRGGVPRFMEDDGYARSFGLQWKRYRRTQLDRYNGTTLSRDRLIAGTGWTLEALRGQRMLDVGCGAGRFTQVLLDAGADVYALDRSSAVEACWDNHGPHPRLCVVQADVYAMPFRREVFDRVLCYGVLQHTPDVRRAFMSLLPFLKPGGCVAVDVYHRAAGLARLNRWGAKYWWRPMTRRLPPSVLAKVVEWYVPRWLPVDTRLERVPGIGRWLVSLVPCWNYTGKLPLTDSQLTEWAMLDTFDALSALYDAPQTLDAVRSWFDEAGLTNVDVRVGGNGIVASGFRPTHNGPETG